jgi:hypothetical protein
MGSVISAGKEWARSSVSVREELRRSSSTIRRWAMERERESVRNLGDKGVWERGVRSGREEEREICLQFIEGEKRERGAQGRE